MRRRCGNFKDSTDPGSQVDPARSTRRDPPGTGGRYSSGPAIAREVHRRGPGCAFHHPDGSSRLPDPRVDRVGVRARPPRRTVVPSHRRTRADRWTRADASDGIRRSAAGARHPRAPCRAASCRHDVRSLGPPAWRRVAGVRWQAPMRALVAAAGGARCGRRWLDSTARLVLVCRPPEGWRPEAKRAEIAQLVEHATENRGVASSILALGTIERTRVAGCAIERKWLSW